MQSSLASGSAEIVMCINVVTHRGQSCLMEKTTHHKARTGHGCLTGRTTHQKAHRGHGCLTGRTTHQKAHRGHGCLTGRTTTKWPTGGKNASLGGQPPNGPQGAKMHHLEDTHQRPTGGYIACNGGARHVKTASLGGHSSMAHGGKKCV